MLQLFVLSSLDTNVVNDDSIISPFFNIDNFISCLKYSSEIIKYIFLTDVISKKKYYNSKKTF